MQYPYTRLPHLIELHNENVFPELNQIKFPIHPKQKFVYKNILIASAIVVIYLLAMMFGQGWKMQEKDNESFWVVLVLSIGILVFVLIYLVQGMLENLILRQEYLVRKSVYEKELALIKNENRQREREVKKLEDIRYRNEYIKMQSELIFKTYSYKEEKYKTPLENSIANLKGKSEQYFLRFLFSVFGKDVKDFYHFENGSYSYEPDFVFENGSIAIDIEVDEPYIVQNKKAIPIHVTDETKNKERDDWFSSINWSVIRFSESQVLLYPYECCKYIAEFISKHTGENKYLKHRLLSNCIEKLVENSRWTKSDALQLAKINSRETDFKQALTNSNNKSIFPENYFQNSGKHLLTVMALDCTIYGIREAFENHSFIQCYDSSGFFKSYNSIYVSSEIAHLSKKGELLEIDTNNHKTEEVNETNPTLYKTNLVIY